MTLLLGESGFIGGPGVLGASGTAGAQQAPGPNPSTPQPPGSSVPATPPSSSTTSVPDTSSTTVPAPPATLPDPETLPPVTGILPPLEGPVTDPADPPAPRRVSPEELIPPPIDIASLEELLSVRRAAAVAEVAAVVEIANAKALATVVEAREALDAIKAQMEPAEAAVAAATKDEAEAGDRVGRARDLVGDLAVQTYQLAVVGLDASTAGRLTVPDTPAAFELLTDSTVYGEAAWRSLDTGIERARGEHASSSRARESAEADLEEIEDRVSAARRALGERESELEKVAADGRAAVEQAREVGEDFVMDGLGPTILGETVVGAADMAAFVAKRGGAAAGIDLITLAMHFQAEAEAEGVRGDIAWVQSILETGNFGYRGSMVNVSDNNYAGIGACDSCSGGFSYPSPQLGARAQMQLLHAYADPLLTTAGMAHPPVRRPPEKVGVRGCCATWMELSGVWATGPGYGQKILTIYNELLAFAAARQRLGAVVLPGPSDAPPPAAPGQP